MYAGLSVLLFHVLQVNQKCESDLKRAANAMQSEYEEVLGGLRVRQASSACMHARCSGSVSLSMPHMHITHVRGYVVHPLLACVHTST